MPTSTEVLRRGHTDTRSQQKIWLAHRHRPPDAQRMRPRPESWVTLTRDCCTGWRNPSGL